MEALFVSTIVVAVGEVGDKTQLLALVLAARFQRPLPIITGIACATVVNHAIAGLAGSWGRSTLTPEVARWVLGLSFFAMAAWALVPDKLEAGAHPAGRYGAFFVTLVAFFFAEIGDKTQLATAMLAAKYGSIAQVVGGSTLGMLCADVPAVLLGNAVRSLPLKPVRLSAALLFVALGSLVLLGHFALA
jgi:putative Ca2+/H+ antiporter (TMEM165/GDT1 family)